MTPRSGSVRRSCLCCFSKEVALYWTNLGVKTCPLWFPDSSFITHIPASQRLSFSREELGVSPILETRLALLQWEETQTLLHSLTDIYGAPTVMC